MARRQHAARGAQSMRITCPQCQAGYDVDPEKIPAAGLRVRCPQCERVFSVRMAAHATTLSGQPSAPGPVPTMPGVPPPAPGGASGPRAGMTMVGMVPPPSPGAETDPDAPVPLPGNAPPPPAAEPDAGAPFVATRTFVGAPPPRPTPSAPSPAAVATTPTGAIPLPAPSGEDAAPWPPPEDPGLSAAAPPFEASETLEPEFVEPIEDLVPSDPVPEPLSLGEQLTAEEEPPPLEEPPAFGEPPPLEEPPPAPAEPLSFGEVPLDHTEPPTPPDPFAAARARAAGPAAPPDEELEMLFSPAGEGPPAPPSAPAHGGEVHYKVRRPSGRVFGPFSEREIVDMLGKGELNGNEDVSSGDRDEWVPVATAAVFAPAVKRMNEAPLVQAAPPAPSVGGAPAGGVPVPFQPRMQSGFRDAVEGGL